MARIFLQKIYFLSIDLPGKVKDSITYEEVCYEYIQRNSLEGS